MVATVAGDIEPAELGITLVHEHILIDMYEVTLASASVLNDTKAAVTELASFRGAGGRTIVDQTVHGLGGDPRRLREVAEEAEVNLIAGTGFYWERFHPPWLEELSDSALIRLLVRDLTEGIGGTDVRAGILGEIGTGHRTITDAEKRVLQACASAQRECPVPISTHALFTPIGLGQLDILDQAGADLDHVVIGHVDTVPDPGYAEQILVRGAWVAFDSVGQLDKRSDESRAEAIADLVRRGHRDRILISSDVCRRTALTLYGGPGYAHVLVNFVPLLLDAGLTGTDVKALLVHNPRRLFTLEETCPA